MIPPGLPLNEAERLTTLYQLKILDTEKEERFDRITRIACKLFDVPIAVISFIEAERQWMKSTCGFDIKEAIRETSFCGHVILSDEIMVVEDATKDTRFHDNPFVLGKPHIKFYLGCPLKVQGCNVGAFCLIDDKSRELKEIDQEAMRDLSAMVQLELESLHFSTTDPLTGLSNRQGFLKITNYLFRMCQRDHKNFNLLFFTLDNYKEISAKFGIKEANKVLKIFSESLLRLFLNSDVIARIADNEFCVFCSGVDTVDLETITQRLKNRLKAFENKKYSIEFNVGAQESQGGDYTTLEELLKLADSKMFYGKKDESF